MIHHAFRPLAAAMAISAFCWSIAPTAFAESVAQDVLTTLEASAGLIVHLNCGDGRLTAELCSGESALVQGLADNQADVTQARQHVRSLGLYGQVTINAFDGRHLPYIDNLVNLIVAEQNCTVAQDEILRALAPGGMAVFLDAPSKTIVRKLTKPVPAEMDEWTHFLHGPDGHVMSQDSIVGPPEHIQWVGSPRHAKSHTHLTTLNVMVSSGGRMFYIVDESPTALPESLPSRWALVARDAFNGIELWRRPLASWQPSYVADRNSYPADLHRRLVAVGDMVFATMSIYGPVSALDAATGRTIRTYADTEKTEDIVFEDGILYLSMNTGDVSEIDRLKMAYRHVEPTQKRVMAIRAEDGEVLWEKCDDDTNGLMPLTLAVKGDYLYLQNAANIVSLYKATGDAFWRSERPSDYFRPGWSSPTLVAFDDVVVSADRQSGPNQKLGKDQYAAGGFSTGDLVVFDAATGRRLWAAPCAEGCRAPTDVFSLDNQLWFGKTLERRYHEYRQAHDLHTGEVLNETPLEEQFPNWHHHRCYRDKATVNYILGSRTGVEFIDLKTGEVKLHNWIRGNCKYGVLPCNGLLYIPPDQCGCYIESRLTGFHALAPKRSSESKRQDGDSPKLETGPAYDPNLAEPTASTTDASSWPTYRADNARSGSTAAKVATDLQQAWQAKLGGRLTQPVVANGRLLVASIDANTLYILDAKTGAIQNEFIAGGRIDSPPTIAAGLAVFGCRDGWIYAIRCDDGQLAWRYRAAPAAQQLVDNDRLESVWPLHGSVLVQDGAVFFAAGRSSYVDGGVRMGKLELATGKLLMDKTFYSRDIETGDPVNLYKPFAADSRLQAMEMPGVLPDVLSSDGDRVWMRAVTFNSKLEIQQEFPTHLFSSMGFLDDSWWELSYWIYGDHMFGGRSGIAKSIGMYPTARIMVFDDDTTYGYQDGYETIPDAALIAAGKHPEKTGLKGDGRYRYVSHQWRKQVPLHANGLVLAGDTLFLAGPPKINTVRTREILATLATDEYDWPPELRKAAETFQGKHGGLLCAVDKRSGETVMQASLASIPVFDGLIAAGGRLYLSQQDGSVVCLTQPQ